MFADSTDDFEGSAQESALMKLWSRRLTLTGGLLDDPETTILEDVFPAAGQEDDSGSEKCQQQQTSSLWESIDDFKAAEEQLVASPPERLLHLNAALLGDVPASYTIPAGADHEYPVVGAWLDPRVVQGFRYRVRRLQHAEAISAADWLFRGRALTLLSIGRGYSRRLTFEADHKALNYNDNYFWSDSRPEGFAFELQVVNPGDKFTVVDSSGDACAVLEVVLVRGPQREIQQAVLAGGRVEKTVTLQTLAKVEWFEEGHASGVLPVCGNAVCVRRAHGVAARVTSVTHVTLGVGGRRGAGGGYTLTPGVVDKWRRTTVHSDVAAAKYTVVGLEPHEIPVIGMYVDPRLTPGFEYRLRIAGSRQPLFEHRVVRLLSVGRGYGKRLTFAADVGRLNDADNYLWSDSHPDGVGFEPRAVHVGMEFVVEAAGQTLAVATVFRADNAQQEVAQEVLTSPSGSTVIIKHIQVDVTCHVTLLSTNETRDSEVVTMRVSGRAVLTLDPATQRTARLVKLVNIGLDSQLFVTQQDKLTLYPNW